MGETLPDVVRHADTAYEAIRAINHLTIGGVVVPPTAYELIGNLKALSNTLPQAVKQIGAGLAQSLEQFEVFEDKGADPQKTVDEARMHLLDAAADFDAAANKLELAQQAVAHLGFRQPSLGTTET